MAVDSPSGGLSLILRSLRNDHDQRDASKQSVYVWVCVCEEEEEEEEEEEREEGGMGGWAVSCARQHE